MNQSFTRMALLVFFVLSLLVDSSDAFAQGGLFGDSVKETGGSKKGSKSKKEEEPSNGTEVRPQQTQNGFLSDMASDIVDGAMGSGAGEEDNVNEDAAISTTAPSLLTTEITTAETGSTRRRKLLRGKK